jgi:hypothetical protein
MIQGKLSEENMAGNMCLDLDAYGGLPGVQLQDGGLSLGGGRVEGAWKLFGMQWSQTGE